MADGAVGRLGGICGILYVLLLIPAYVVGYPDAPGPTSSALDVADYFGVGRDAFVLGNGTLAIFSMFFFLWFLGALYGILRRAEGESAILSSVALAGGVLFAALASAGFATEILYPATIARFDNFAPDPQLVFLSLALSAWLYHFCQVGTAAMAISTSLLALGTGVFPRWLALAGLVVALLALLHFLLPLIGALAGLLWVAVVSVLMLVGAGGPSSRGSRRLRG